LKGQVRTGQLIAPFGPGAIYTDSRGTPLVVCGLDHWYKIDRGNGLLQCENPDEFDIVEPRLSALLNVNRFRMPADYRAVHRGQQAPPNAFLSTPAQRFPRWYRNSYTNEMRRLNLNTETLPAAPSGRWLPVRFIAVCGDGHLSEFPWKRWIGCECQGDGNLFLIDRGGSALSTIRVECRSCPEGSTGRRGRTLSGTTGRPNEDEGGQSAFQNAGINCSGDRPWLGEGANEHGCTRPLVCALINQTNIYFPKTISAIFLPDMSLQDDSIMQLRDKIQEAGGACGVALTLWKDMNMRKEAIALVSSSLVDGGISFKAEQLELAVKSLFEPNAIVNANTPAKPESDLLAFRRAEFNIIRNEVNDPVNIPNLRVIPADVPHNLEDWITTVNLVERLRETRVFYGFDRLEPNSTPLVGMPGSAMRQLFRNPPMQRQEQWLPATKVFGEGIYLEFKEKMITQWQEDNKKWLTHRLNQGFITRLSGIFQTLPPSAGTDWIWASRYLLVHSLAHILINQLVFECGYSTASLRERLYISNDSQAPMAGILIYTAAGDSEGTLGGLVRLGHKDRLESIIRQAVSRASWCSADPVCSEIGGQGSRFANLAACHACTLLPETSCETINQGLDRAMIVGTPDNRAHGFMAKLLDEIYSLEGE